jgi:hypothetical protein
VRSRNSQYFLELTRFTHNGVLRLACGLVEKHHSNVARRGREMLLCPPIARTDGGGGCSFCSSEYER